MSRACSKHRDFLQHTIICGFLELAHINVAYDLVILLNLRAYVGVYLLVLVLVLSLGLSVYLLSYLLALVFISWP